MSYTKFYILGVIIIVRGLWRSGSKKVKNSFTVVTWRHYVIFGLFSLILFSASVILLELAPSHWLINTSFVATIEARSIKARVGNHLATLSGIEGSHMSLHDRKEEAFGNAIDLTQIDRESPTKIDNGLESDTSFDISSSSTSTHLELDSLSIPAGQVLEMSVGQSRDHLFLGVLNDSNDEVSTTLVWNGAIQSNLKNDITTKSINAYRWVASEPVIEIDDPVFNDLSSNPIQIVGLSSELLANSGLGQIPVSTVLSGELQFYFGRYPAEPITLRRAELAKFGGLNALLMSTELTNSGIKIILVGTANSVRVGYQNKLRSVTPSLLDGLLSIRSLTVIFPALFALLLAFLSAVSLTREENRGVS